MDWFRMYGEFYSDPKVQSMNEAMQRRLVMLLCLRCSNVLVTLQDEEIAFALRITEGDLAETKELFKRKGFVNDSWEIANWDKRQFVSDSSAARVARHREKARELQERDCNVTVSAQIQNRTDTEQINTIVSGDAADLIQIASTSKPTCPHQSIIDLYHAELPVCPRIKDWTPARQTHLRARWNEDTERQDLDYWQRLFGYIATCDFLVGKGGGTRPFFAGLEWIVKSENFAKIREGKYQNNENRS
jgi:hypothetical protein